MIKLIYKRQGYSEAPAKGDRCRLKEALIFTIGIPTQGLFPSVENAQAALM